MTQLCLRSSHWLPLVASALVFACQTTPATPDVAAPEPVPESAAPEPSADGPPECSAAPGWRPERIELPPAFAPSMPAGNELLWFAPGMFDPAADDYFSYVFELALTQTPPADPAEIQAVLHAYYSGLMSAVAADTERTPGEVVIAVESSDDAHFVAVVEMTDEFTGGAPIKVTLDLERTSTCIVATVTPSDDAEVRAALQRARSCLPCASGPSAN